jgi:hypothetical protein
MAGRSALDPVEAPKLGEGADLGILGIERFVGWLGVPGQHDLVIERGKEMSGGRTAGEGD